MLDHLLKSLYIFCVSSTLACSGQRLNPTLIGLMSWLTNWYLQPGTDGLVEATSQERRGGGGIGRDVCK